MQMHQIRYFLALCEEKSFTLALGELPKERDARANAPASLSHSMRS